MKISDFDVAMFTAGFVAGLLVLYGWAWVVWWFRKPRPARGGGK